MNAGSHCLESQRYNTVSTFRHVVLHYGAGRIQDPTMFSPAGRSEWSEGIQLFMVLCTFSRSAAHVHVEEPRLCVNLKGSERSVSIGNDIDIETVHEPIGYRLSQRKRDADDGVVLILNGRASVADDALAEEDDAHHRHKELWKVQIVHPVERCLVKEGAELLVDRADVGLEHLYACAAAFSIIKRLSSSVLLCFACFIRLACFAKVCGRDELTVSAKENRQEVQPRLAWLKACCFLSVGHFRA
ncbi:hypothetical protein L1887_54444 [Cichorium endivia]|nr:hypothetical protein L1887_54444 [Cichorium endivia]